MTSATKRADLHDGTTRVAVVVAEPIQNRDDVLPAYHRLFDALGHNPRLLLCDLYLPETITIKNQGNRWTAEATARIPSHG